MVYSQLLVGVSPWRVLVKTGRSGKEQGETGEQRNYGVWERVKRWVLRHERNWLRERESALQVWEEVQLATVVEWCVSGAKDLRFIGREFHKLGEKLRNDRSANLSLVETGAREKTQMIWGTGSAGRFDIYEPVEVLWFGYMEEVVCNGDDQFTITVNPRWVTFKTSKRLTSASKLSAMHRSTTPFSPLSTHHFYPSTGRSVVHVYRHCAVTWPQWRSLIGCSCHCCWLLSKRAVTHRK